MGTRFGRIAYTDRGSGNVALFPHGFPLSSFQRRGAIERLSPYKRCIAPDFLGMGLTEVANGEDVSPNAQVEMVVELVDKLSIETVDIIANDSGGAVAQLFLTRYGQRIRSLLLTNCDTELISWALSLSIENNGATRSSLAKKPSSRSSTNATK